MYIYIYTYIYVYIVLSEGYYIISPFHGSIPLPWVLEKWRVMPTTPPDRLKAGWGSLAGSNLWEPKKIWATSWSFSNLGIHELFANSKVKSKCRCFFQVLFYKFCPNLGTCFSWKLTNFFHLRSVWIHWSVVIGASGQSAAVLAIFEKQ